MLEFLVKRKSLCFKLQCKQKEKELFSDQPGGKSGRQGREGLSEASWEGSESGYGNKREAKCRFLQDPGHSWPGPAL